MKLLNLCLLSLIAVLMLSCTSESFPDGVSEVYIEIYNGKIDYDISITQGDKVTFKVTSDKAGVLHIHGYDIRVDVFQDKDSSVEFVAKATGLFKLAFHEAADTDKKEHGHKEVVIGNIQVLPK